VSRFTSYVEIALGADLTGTPTSWSWTDISSFTHQPSGINIQRGRPDWFSQTPPARCNLTLINNGGRFVPRNPTGPYYGSLRRNTPLRVLFRPNTNSLSDAFNRTSSSSWGSADVGGAWTNAGGAASDFSVSSTDGGRHLHTAASSAHYSTLGISVLRHDVRVKVKTAALATGAALTAAVVARYLDANNSHRYELQFNTDQSLTGRLVFRSGGTDTVEDTATITGLTHSAGTWYWIRAQSGYNSARLKVWQDGTTEPATWNIDGGFLPSIANGAIGCYSVRETGNTNANATLDFDDFSMVDGPRIQFTGYVDEWPTTWTDASGNQSLAPITCSGLLRRIQQGQALRSALFRAHTEGYYAGSAVAYWPMEDASGSGSLASGVGGTPMEYVDFSLGSDSSIAGSDSLPTAGTNAYLYGTVPAYTSSTTWAVRFVAKIPQAPTVNSGFVGWSTPGSTIIFWLFVLNSDGTYTMQGYNSALADVLGASSPGFIDQDGVSLYDRQVYVEVNGTQNGSNIDWDINIWSGTTGVGMIGSVAGTNANVANISHRASPGFTTTAGYTIGHIAISNNSAFGASAYGSTGYSGEATDLRLQRLCNEENLPYIFGELLNQTLLATQLMGPQPTASLISQLREIEATEAGILHDGKQGHVTILPRALRYNRTVELSLTVASGYVGWPFEARDDDQALRNDITASRPRGSSARATDTASIAAVGVYSDSVTVNTETDPELFQHASWRVHLGTVEELRYPSIKLDFARNPTLIDAWCDADIGSRLQIAGPPSELPPDTIDLHIEGYTESFDGSQWTASLNTSPALPWQTTTLEASGNRGRLDTAGCSLLADYTAGATSLLVATTVPPKWSTSSVPYDWGIAGERVTVTGMATNAISYVGVGTAAHAVDANVTPGMPASIAKGDLLLCWAATRGTTGTVGLPSGWTSLVQLANVRLIGKIYDGSEAAPTIVMTSSGGNDCSAQIAAWRNAQLSLISSTSQTNGGAQNIAVPALTGLDRDNCLVVVCGWKQDDWTSVAALTGFTEIAEFTSTAGADHGLVWDYVIQTTVAATSSTTFTVTGGTSQQSKAVVVALAGDVQTATVTRAVNGVSKAQSANASVSLWKPGVTAL
jgi:hypothetical protein